MFPRRSTISWLDDWSDDDDVSVLSDASTSDLEIDYEWLGITDSEDVSNYSCNFSIYIYMIIETIFKDILRTGCRNRTLFWHFPNTFFRMTTSQNQSTSVPSFENSPTRLQRS